MAFVLAYSESDLLSLLAELLEKNVSRSCDIKTEKYKNVTEITKKVTKKASISQH